MEKKIVLTPRFSKNYKALLIYLEKEWSIKVAAEFVEKINLIVLKISKYPEAGQASLKRKGVRSMIVNPHNRIYYFERANKIELLAIIEMRINPSKNPFR